MRRRKEIANFFERTFRLQLGNTLLLLQEICRRKKTCQFLPQFANKLGLYVDGIEEKRFGKR